MSESDQAVVVIGYGNALRGDDGVGRVVVESLAKRDLPDVVSVSVTQLLPELAATIARAKAVIFVDASAAPFSEAIEVRELHDSLAIGGATHHSGPAELLAMAATCFGAAPPAWLVSIRATEFEYTDGLSASALTKVELAIDAVERLIERLRACEVSHA